LEVIPIRATDTKKARINLQIRAREVRLIGADGEQVGIVNIAEALKKAEESNLDLVEIAPNIVPPVCRVMDYGKYLFEQSKKFKKKTKQVHLKELKLRPVTEIGDYNIKIRQAADFLKGGDKVRFVVRFRGRELSYQEQGLDILRRIENDLKDYGVVEQQPKAEGKQLVMIIIPGKHKPS
jgi:translation initiation factor IF-3